MTKNHGKIMNLSVKTSIFAKNLNLMDKLFSIAGHFVNPKVIEDIAPLGNGLINDTYKIIMDGKPHYVLQRINNAVFTDVEMLQNNIEVVTDHIRKKYESQGVADINRRVLHFLKADTG